MVGMIGMHKNMQIVQLYEVFNKSANLGQKKIFKILLLARQKGCRGLIRKRYFHSLFSNSLGILWTRAMDFWVSEMCR